MASAFDIPAASPQQPMATSPVTPAPQATSPAAPATQPPTVNPNSAFQTNVQGPPPTPQPSTQINISNGQTPTDTTQQSQPTTAPPGTSLQPGAQGQDVQQLQQYLAQMGYLTPDQIATGPGTYGPQTTAAVAKMQQDLGISPGTGSGAYGPNTQQALAQKYQGLFSAVKNTTTPDTGAAARAAIGGALDQTSDSSNNPVFSALTTAMQPIMQSLTQVLNNVNNPALTAVSLQSEYNTLRDQYNLPAMNAQLMNMTNIMNGTVGDIRTEITSAGGLATESQVQGMASARNLTIQKQYNALSTQYNAAQQNVQAMMQYATTDQSQALQRSQLSASITESMASISSQMVNMGMTMQNNAREAVQYNVTQMGYKGLAASTDGNPQMQSYYENMLGLEQGSLSDPATIATMDTYKDQQLLLNQYRAAAYGFNSGYGGSPGGSNPYGGSSDANNDPMSASNPGGNPQGPGTQALSDGLLLQPNSSTTGHSIMQATGLNLSEYSALTNSKTWSALPKGQKMNVSNQVNTWLGQHSNVDMATFQSQYTTLNQNVNDYTTRYNNMSLAEKNFKAAIPTIDPAAEKAGLGDVNIENVTKIALGQQVNDPSANSYMLYYKDLQNSLAYFYAAQRGNKSADDADESAAAKVITGGIAQGGIKGINDAFNNISSRESLAVASNIDDTTKQIWSLFGAGDQYKPPSQQMITMNYKGSPVFVPASRFDEALKSGYSLAGTPLPNMQTQ